MSPMRGLNRVTALVHIGCYQAPARFRARRRPDRLRDSIAERIPLAGRGSRVPVPGTVAVGEGPDRRPGPAIFATLGGIWIGRLPPRVIYQGLGAPGHDDVGRPFRGGS